MKFVTRCFRVLITLLMFCRWSWAHPFQKWLDPEPLVQIALLLDTSNSMDGLISQAKSQLWRTVNDLSMAERNGRHPIVEVALYEYGNSGLESSNNYIRQVLPLTTDLDLVSEKLFSLTTNGGEEYCGAVIGNSLANLQWSSRDDAYKTIFIAGNEPFSQGPIRYQDSITATWRKGIHVNTIFCGVWNEGQQTGWASGATLGGGRYASINADSVVSVVRSPYDDRIVQIGQQINNTYVSYGKKGIDSQSRLKAMDQAATQIGSGANVERQLFKSSKQYAKEWDAVEKLKEGTKIEELKAQLPEAYQQMSADQLSVELGKKDKERTQLQEELQVLQKKRASYLVEADKKSASGSDKTLDKALQETIREQATKKNFLFNSKGGQ